jgi:G:T-mismatch repair DNA endonuclease (very short patch repair protein)
MSKSRLGHEVTEETRLKLKESRKNYTHSEETRKKMSESQKKAWLEGRKTYPEFLLNYSSYEVRLQPIAEKLGFVATYKDPFFIRSGSRTRIPDFVNTESKEIIEIFGTYWHRDQKLPEGQRHETPEEVIEWYGELGWKCTVVWAEEEFEEFYNELYKKSKKL